MAERISPEWLKAPALQALFDALEQHGDEARVVGGAVRNTLFDLAVSDIDLSTTALPGDVVRRVEAAGMKAVPTGIDHGTVTVVAKGVAYEVTTLREDVETHGRRATVRFGRDWLSDAMRRDFTMNALYADRDGKIFDPVGGLADLHARRVRFIGDPAARIAEDYLRILRFFRFHAQYGAGEPDAAGLHAVIEARDGLRHLSAERIGMEMRKLVAAPGAAETLALMSDTGLVEVVLAGVARIVDFRNLRRLDAVAPQTRSPALGLAALAGFVDEDIARISERMRLSNAERKRMLDALHLADRFAGRADTAFAREMAYRAGRVAALDGFLLHWARKGGDPLNKYFLEVFKAVKSFHPPAFPLKGRDLLAAGIASGPKVGETMAQLEARWIASGFALTREALLESIALED